MSGPHFRDYHLLLDEQAEQLYDMTDPMAERFRKIGGTTLRSTGHIGKLQRVQDNAPKPSSRSICWRNCEKTKAIARAACAKRMSSATNTKMLRAPA